MTDREKLIEILRVPIYPHLDADPAEVVADYLLDNGVTFVTDNNVGGKWIPVTERLPQENGYYLCWVFVSAVNQRKEYRRMVLFWEDNVWIDMANCFWIRKPTHWMPLPEPPKGE
jgi:hypothetical protein